MDTDPADDFRVYTRFENKDEFITLRDQLLGLDLYTEPSQEQAQSESQIGRAPPLHVETRRCDSRTSGLAGGRTEIQGVHHTLGDEHRATASGEGRKVRRLHITFRATSSYQPSFAGQVRAGRTVADA